jgi:hypothetical protein
MSAFLDALHGHPPDPFAPASPSSSGSGSPATAFGESPSPAPVDPTTYAAHQGLPIFTVAEGVQQAKAVGKAGATPTDPMVALAAGQAEAHAAMASLDQHMAMAMDAKAYAADPAAAIAHQKALRVMGQMLEVKAPGAAAGPANAVSKAEFDKMVQLYGNLELGKTDIQFAGGGAKPGEAKANSMDDLARLLQTPSGRALVAQLADNHGGTKSKGKHVITTIDGAHATMPNSYAVDGAQASCNGVGSPAAVEYPAGHPYHLAPKPWGDVRSDVVLFHELTHALHQTHGDAAMASVPKVDPVDNFTAPYEYQAVGLGPFAGAAISENAYRKERAAVGAAEQITSTNASYDDATMPQRPTYNY